MVVVTLPIRLVSEANAHEHWRSRQRRAKAQREAAYVLIRYALSHSPVAIPATVTITRIAPNMLDSDNCVGSAKHVRDGIADALGVNDRDPRVTWVVRQERGRSKEYAVKVVILSDTFAARADQFGATCGD